MWVFELLAAVLVVVTPYASGAAVVLSLAQAWAVGSTRWRACRYVIAAVVCAAILVTPLLVFLGFPGTIYPAHRNVAWTGGVLSAAITVAVFAIAARRAPASALESAGFFARAWALFPRHLAMLAVFASLGYIVVLFVFMGNIH